MGNGNVIETSYKQAINILNLTLLFVLLSTMLTLVSNPSPNIFAQQQNWSTYEDPLIGIQFEYPSWWNATQEEDLVKFYMLADPDDLMYYEVFTNVHYFLPPLPQEMNTLDMFMWQMINELRSDFTQNISVNRTSTIGVDDIPAYRVEYDDILGNDISFKNIRYFSIDNSTGTGFMISLHTEMDRSQEDVPLFERLVESFKILS